MQWKRSMLNNFKYSKIEVLIKAQKPQYFLGSMLRGALGYSLKKVTCINPSFTCNECFAQSNCLYYDFYENSNSYHKYRLDFDLNSELFEFNLFLYSNTTEKLPYLLSALHKLFLEQGIGKDRVKPKEFFFYIDGKVIYDGKEFKIPKDFIKEFQPDSYSANLKIKFQTPLRIKRENKLVGAKEFNLELLLTSIYHRYQKLSQKELTKLPYEPKYEIKEQNLRWKRLTRYSNRQQTKMSMDGLIGEITIKNIDKKSYKLLKLGEIIGAGKQTVMGLGKIEIKDIDE